MTPSVSNSQGNEYTRDRGEIGLERLTLTGQAAQWPTPSAAVMNDAESPESWHARAEAIKERGINGNGAGLPLTIAAKSWPTPNSRDHKGSDHKGSDLPSRNGGASLSHAAEQGVFSHSSPQAPQMVAGLACSPSTPTSPLRLNPAFGEWLMGWPSQWTRAEPSASSASATALWRSRLQSQLSSLLEEQQG